VKTILPLWGAAVLATPFMPLQADAASIGVRIAARPTLPYVLQARMQRRPIFTVLPARGVQSALLPNQAAHGATIPFFRSSITSPLDGKRYKWEMVGTNPMTNQTTTTVNFVPILARVHFIDGSVLDPTQPACNDTVAVADRLFGSPLFNAVDLISNGIDVGTTQIIDGFQRANFWKYVAGTNFHVLLAPAAKPVLVDITAPTGSITQTGACSGSNHNMGEIDINAWDAIVRKLDKKYAQPNQLPIVATYNVFQTEYHAVCCVLGYHSAFARPGGTQTYAVGAYNDPGEFSQPIEDIHAWTHELGEWTDDPFVQSDNYNFTPAWGNVGQVNGCQDNLEVGDPLTGTPFLVTYNGFTYHPQELAFFSWFYRTPPTGTGGLYSFEGTFTSAQGTCTG